nr:ribosome small subunit-dependent GTPase A [Thioalkalivibrio sp.]
MIVTLRCRVVARFGSEIDVLPPTGGILRAHLRRKFDDVVCGDVVLVEPEERIVTGRELRVNHLGRQDGFNRHRTIAANIDRVWIVVAPRPEIPHLLIDRFLVGIFNLPARAAVVINKYDLVDAVTAKSLEASLTRYRHLDLPVLPVSAHTGFGMESFRNAAAGGSNILVGQSGVGKSSLIQAMLPEQSLRVGAVGHSGEGRHTTTTARWYPFAGGGAWIDSPGVRDFTPEITSIDELLRGFPDLGDVADGCRFRNCTHRSEPGCAVRQVVKQGLLPEARLNAWLELLQGLSGGSSGRRES